MKTSKILPMGLMLVMAGWTVVPTFGASVKGRRNTMIGLGAGTLYHALRGHPREAIAFGVGTGVAYHRYEKARRAQSWRRRHAYSSYASSGGGRTYVRSASSGRYAPSHASSGSSAHQRIDSLKAQTVSNQAALQRQIDQLSLQTQELSAQNRRLVSQLGMVQADNVKAQGASADAQGDVSRYRLWALIATLIAIPSLVGFGYMLFKNRGNPQFRRIMQTS